MTERRLIGGLIALVLICAVSPTAAENAEESSDAYLRNVVSELQLMNGQSSPIVQERFSAGNSKHEEHRHQSQRLQQQKQQQQQLKWHQVVNLKSPEDVVLGFSPTRLAEVYKKATERGTTIKYGPFISTLTQQIPSVDNKLELEVAPLEDQTRPEDLEYAYYFYPVQALPQELANQHGFRTVPNINYDSLPAKSSKKEINAMNPLLMGISSFMGMAIFFLFSLFIYPRFMHFIHFPFFATSRNIFQNELTNLTAFVTEAIDYYNKNMRQKSKQRT